MKRIFVLSSIVMAVLSPDTSFAQQNNNINYPSGFRLSIATDAGIPVGVFRDRYEWSMGVAAQVEKPVVGNKLSIVGSTGYTRVFARSTKINAGDIQLIPFRAGLKYFPLNNFYIQGQAGTSVVVNKPQTGYNRSFLFNYVPQVGYQFPVGPNFIDAGIRWEGNGGYKKTGAFNNTAGIRIAYNFGL